METYPGETSHLLGKSCPSKCLTIMHCPLSPHEHSLDNIKYHSQDDSSSEDDKYNARSLNPTIGRRHSNPQRTRSNSIAIFHEDEDDVIFTSFGPVVVEETARGVKQIKV